MLLWLPIRAGILLAMYLHEVVWMDLGPEWIESPMLPMRLFWSTPVHLCLLAGPVLLAWRCVRGRRTAGRDRGTRPAGQSPISSAPAWLRPAVAALLTAAGVVPVPGSFGIPWAGPSKADPHRGQSLAGD